MPDYIPKYLFKRLDCQNQPIIHILLFIPVILADILLEKDEGGGG